MISTVPHSFMRLARFKNILKILQQSIVAREGLKFRYLILSFNIRCILNLFHSCGVILKLDQVNDCIHVASLGDSQVWASFPLRRHLQCLNNPKNLNAKEVIKKIKHNPQCKKNMTFYKLIGHTHSDKLITKNGKSNRINGNECLHVYLFFKSPLCNSL